MSESTKLLIRKLIVAFLVAFVGPFVPLILGLGQNGGMFIATLWKAALFAGVAAGVRALLAFSPINLVPSDAQHKLMQKGTATSITTPTTIDTKGG